MLKMTSPTQSLGISPLLIDVAEEDKVGSGSSNGIKSTFTIMSKKATKADYLNFEGTVGVRSFGYLIPDTKKAFNNLRNAFTKTPIFQHFGLKRHIPVETNTSGHTISGILNQLTLNDLSQWPLVAYYLRKMISAKTQYKTHNNELLAIIKAFKILR